MFNSKKAIENLKTYLKDKTPQILSAPSIMDQNGEKAVYHFEGDIFILNFKNSIFAKAEIKSKDIKNIRFSPNGENIAYVSSNDIYVYNISRKKETRITFDGSETMLNGTLSWVYWEEIFGRSDMAFWWSDDSKAIAYLQSDESPVGLVYFPDFEPATPRVIKQRYAKTGEPNPVVKQVSAKSKIKKPNG